MDELISVWINKDVDEYFTLSSLLYSHYSSYLYFRFLASLGGFINKYMHLPIHRFRSTRCLFSGREGGNTKSLRHRSYWYLILVIYNNYSLVFYLLVYHIRHLILIIFPDSLRRPATWYEPYLESWEWEWKRE